MKPKRAPTFDADGYPTDETLREIRHWPVENSGELMRYCARAWSYPDRFVRVERPEEDVLFREGSEWWRVSTGGWSGNEDIIEAMRSNHPFWLMCWFSSRRGGHYVFEVTSSFGAVAE